MGAKIEELRGVSRRATTEHIPVELLAEHVASTFMLVLSRWLESEIRLDAFSAHSQFVALTLPVLASVIAP